MIKSTAHINIEKPIHSLLKRINPKTVISGALFAALLASSGCATSSLLENNNQVSSTPSNNVLSEDQIVAFGRPAQALPKMPNATMVIVGEKNSYVLTQGGTEMVNLLTNLTPKNIQVDNEMKFYVPNNDGYFQGEMKLSYAKLKDEFKRSDYQFFLQNNGKECTSASDQRINAQRFCFSVPVKGAIYPQVSNLSLIQSNYRALSKPYMVSFYTQTQQTQVSRNGPNSAQKLVLLPFALAFDVITFPFQLLEQ
ncbi:MULTISPECIES: hypothetical protein [unclassified Psychrobacter]|uniref:hypothetical protein n=1 Tax=unclassified Psychrobacter TaxID=196806 RepID=UPI0009A78722|nr:MULTISPECIES: hypothetical protein [unclassified Psychrobacter]MDE4454580.1 hypothetical protein [Psychrobacter sp. DAB_AL62B]SLJ83631.1 hypothetical protein DABAL43B_0416 [Psychrobacter sp. DAB_AL43B]